MRVQDGQDVDSFDEHGLHFFISLPYWGGGKSAFCGRLPTRDELNFLLDIFCIECVRFMLGSHFE